MHRSRKFCWGEGGGGGLPEFPRKPIATCYLPGSIIFPLKVAQMIIYLFYVNIFFRISEQVFLG